MTLEIQGLAYITTKYAFWYEKQNQKKMSKLRHEFFQMFRLKQDIKRKKIMQRKGHL